MKPESFLNKLGIEYFRKCEAILKLRGMDEDCYSMDLSVLASEYARYNEAIMMGNKHGFYNQYNNGPQINAYGTMAKDAMNNIMKMSPKFGLTPKDFDAIKQMVKKEEKKSKLVGR